MHSVGLNAVVVRAMAIDIVTATDTTRAAV